MDIGVPKEFIVQSALGKEGWEEFFNSTGWKEFYDELLAHKDEANIRLRIEEGEELYRVQGTARAIDTLLAFPQTIVSLDEKEEPEDGR